MKMIRSMVLVLLLASTALASAATNPQQSKATNAPTTAATAASKPADLFGSEVVAKGKNFEIKRGQLDEALISIKSTATARGQTVSPEQLSLFERQLLEHLIEVKLLVGMANEAEL